MITQADNVTYCLMDSVELRMKYVQVQNDLEWHIQGDGNLLGRSISLSGIRDETS